MSERKPSALIKDILKSIDRVTVYTNGLSFDAFGDNKFLDAAIAANADYLVTDDAHFNAVKKIDFPKVNIISSDKFLDILSK